MCGIVGYIGSRPAAPILVDGLYRLEYRGYDSVGVAVGNGDGFTVVKRIGRVKEIECARKITGRAGIGHTRWATHGGVTVENAHPHAFRNIVLVHNGIIENAAALKEECMQRGETFVSETDSEVVAHVVAAEYRGDLLRAVMAGCRRLRGSYALAVMCADEKDVIVCARMRSPLIVGRAKGGLVLSSDIPAVAETNAALYALSDGEFALLKGDAPSFFNAEGKPIAKETLTFDPNAVSPDLGGYMHFMRKEIDEIPKILPRSAVDFEHSSCFSDFYRVLCQTEYIQIAACGTAYHSGLCAKAAIEELARIPVDVHVASEFCDGDPIIPQNTLFLAISQSGETADTLAAVRLAKRKGAYVAAVTNVPHASLTRLADTVILTNAGGEVAVAATKSFNAQLMALYSLAAALAKIRGQRAPSLKGFDTLAAQTIVRSDAVKGWAQRFANAKSAYFIGRGADRCAALEGSLKLKEISYLPSEGYAAGELKHGTLALIEPSTPVVAVLTRKKTAEKTMNSVHEAMSRGADVFLVTCFKEYADAFSSVLLPRCPAVYSPLLSVIPLQLLAYYTALARGNDPDKPRNLAKSVTVE